MRVKVCYFVVYQPSKCSFAYIQPQIWSILPIYPNDSESLSKVCYINWKYSSILSRVESLLWMMGDEIDADNLFSLEDDSGQRHCLLLSPRSSAFPPKLIMVLPSSKNCSGRHLALAFITAGDNRRQKPITKASSLFLYDCESQGSLWLQALAFSAHQRFQQMF